MYGESRGALVYKKRDIEEVMRIQINFGCLGVEESYNDGLKANTNS